MFNVEDILAQMKNGISAEDMARNFTESLNKAIQVQEEEKKKEVEKQELRAAADDVASHLNQFLETYFGLTDTQTLTGEEVIEICESMKQLESSMKKMLDDDSVFNKFFKDFGLI